MTVSRSQLHIFHSYAWRDTCTKCATSKTVFFYVRRRSGPVSSRQGNESDLRLFLYELLFKVACWLSCGWCTSMLGTIIIFFSVMEVRSVFGNNSPHTWVANLILSPSFKLRTFIIPRYMSWVFSNILSWRGHRIAKLVAEYLGSISAALSCLLYSLVRGGARALFPNSGW